VRWRVDAEGKVILHRQFTRQQTSVINAIRAHLAKFKHRRTGSDARGVEQLLVSSPMQVTHDYRKGLARVLPLLGQYCG
jgi:hypothetical protein